MADENDVNAGADAGAEAAAVDAGNAAVVGAEGAAKADEGATLLGGGDAVDGGSEPAGEADSKDASAQWPDDWRDRLVAKVPSAERDKLAARLKRFSSPDNVLKSLLELERKVSSSGLKATLPENPTDEDLKAYREANGIPEAPDGYGLAFPEGVDVTDADKAELASFQERMHEANIPPAAAKAAFEYYSELREKATQEFGAKAQEATVNARAELRAEFGKDFARNVNVAKNYIGQFMDSESAETLFSTGLADGTRLGDNPSFVRLLVNAGLATAGDDALVAAEYGSAPGGSVEEQYKAAVALMGTDPKAYWAEDHQAKVQKLAAAVAKRRTRAA
jgi:hypothetical protein